MFIFKSTWCLCLCKKIAAVSRRLCDRQIGLLCGQDGRIWLDVSPCAYSVAMLQAVRLSNHTRSRKTPSDQIRRGNCGSGRAFVSVAFLGLDSRFDRFDDGLQFAFDICAIFGIEALQSSYVQPSKRPLNT